MSWARQIEVRRLLTVLAASFMTVDLPIAGALAGETSASALRADPFERGATRLLERPALALLPSATNSHLLAPFAAEWQRLAPELVRYPTTRSKYTVNVAIHRLRQSGKRPLLVFIHGILSDHLTWQYVAAQLSGDYEIWLVDLPGCGESDVPKPTALEPDGYSPTAMGERILQALQHCLEADPVAPPRSITLIGHSLGGAVVIRMMSAPELRNRYAQVIRQIDRMVLVSPCDFAVNGVPPSFRTLLGLKGWMVGLGECLGVVTPRMRELTKTSYHIPKCATLEQQRHYAHALTDSGHREAAKAMLRQFVPVDPKTMRPQWRQIDPLVADYENINVPVLVVYGTWDETLSAAMGNKLKDEIAGAVLVKVPRRGHSLPTEDPVVCAKLIRGFQQGLAAEKLGVEAGVKVYPAVPLLRRGRPVTDN
jgi:pimeloyl-ACP methyl ester carboxylesterase